MHFSYAPYVLHIPSISLSLVRYPSNWREYNCATHHYATFAVCCCVLSLECKYFPPHSALKHLQSTAAAATTTTTTTTTITTTTTTITTTTTTTTQTRAAPVRRSQWPRRVLSFAAFILGLAVRVALD